MFAALLHLIPSNMAMSRSVTLSIFHSRLPTLTYTYTYAVWCTDEGIGQVAGV